MIRLTRYPDGEDIWVNPLMVKCFMKNNEGDFTCIMFIDDTYNECLRVKESPEEVNRLFNL